MWSFAWQALALSHVSLATFKGFVNPMHHWNATEGVVLVLNVSDGESPDDVKDAVEDFRANFEKYQATMSELRRTRNVGRGPCIEDLANTQDVWPTLQQIAEAGFPLVGQYVNIGAHDGRTDDPLYNYSHFTQASGVAIERDPEKCKHHKANLPNVHVMCSEVTPQNVLPLVRQGLNGKDVDVLKIDIDSYDCPVLERILPKVRATMVVVEANPSIPPPYQWAMLYDPNLWNFFNSFHSPEEVPIRGCSLAYEVQLLNRYNYDLVFFNGHDAIFTHEEVRSAFYPHTVPVDEFHCYSEAFIAANGIPINVTRRWFFNMSDVHQGLPEIWRFFVTWMMDNAPVLYPFALRV
ncbi:unnamed protein product [Durusdinium trenchii]|uniref:Methyltransferase FkbM domain-containing protein n=2 Tax=Durusdinium trenchii TaxID=1381693 RepID=A0ABP0KWG0_9DINO